MPPAVLDVVAGAVVTAVIAVAIGANVGGTSAPPAGAYLAALGFGALLTVRRRFPLLVLLVSAAGLFGYYAAGLPPIGLALPLAAALYVAAEAGRVRWAAGTAVVVAGVSTLFRLLEGDDPAFLFGLETTSAVALMAAVIALGDGRRSRRLLRAEMRRREEAAAAEREREAARRTQEERLRIARELHDALGHTTTVISLQAAVAAEALPGDPSAAASAVEAIRQASGEAMRELRVTLGLLRRPTGEAGGRAPVGGLAELDRLVARVRAGGLTATLRILGTAVPVPHVIDVTAYRIVQESLTNVLRHAAATTAEVVVRYGRELEITVSDDGRGGAPGGGGEGLRGMAERAELLDGSVWAGEGEDGGFQVRAVLPLAVPGRAAPPGTARLPAPAAQ